MANKLQYKLGTVKFVLEHCYRTFQNRENANPHDSGGVTLSYFSNKFVQVFSNGETSCDDVLNASMNELSNGISKFDAISEVKFIGRFVREYGNSSYQGPNELNLIYSDDYHDGGKLINRLISTAMYVEYLPAYVIGYISDLFERVKLLKGQSINDIPEQELRKKVIDLYNSVLVSINMKYKSYGEEPKIGRYNFEGSGRQVYPDADNSHGVRLDYHGTRYATMYRGDMDEFPNENHFGFELEGAFPSRMNFDKCCDKLFEIGLLSSKNKLIPTYDSSIEGPYPVEGVSCPMTLAHMKEFAPAFEKVLAEFGFVRGYNRCQGGLHIHSDKSYLGTGEAAYLYRNGIFYEMPEDKYIEVFGREPNCYCRRSDHPDNYMRFIECDDGTHEYDCHVDRYGSLNDTEHTYENRGGDSAKPIYPLVEGINETVNRKLALAEEARREREGE